MNSADDRNLPSVSIDSVEIPCSYRHTLVLGSGCASLSAAVRLKRAGLDDFCVVTDNIYGGTSRNTGSDKQTYYKLSDSTQDPDTPYRMAEALTAGGAMHGDVALIEAIGSVNGFYNLVGMGVPFPYNTWGGYTGYKTDHDPLQRGVSLGPYTSRLMTEYLERECRTLGIDILDHHDVVKLVTCGDRIAGALIMNKRELDSPSRGLKLFICDNMVFGLGGPGGFYEKSVYPKPQNGGIGLALEIGAKAANLTESQYGLTSRKFRWNLSGSYQQVLPRYYSKDKKTGETFDFLNDYFPDMGALMNAVFLKGYQWPFDPRKIPDYGSSLLDVLVYRETEILGRKVYMDFRENPKGDERIGQFSPELFGREAAEYWKNSGINGATPIGRLRQLNPAAIQLYLDHNIDLSREALEIAVSAQHNNGGLAADIWWESVNIRRLFPVGETNGTHGAARPGGTALNSGQVGAFRAAQKIAMAYREKSLDTEKALESGRRAAAEILETIRNLTSGSPVPDCDREYKAEFQQRMSRYAAAVRGAQTVKEAKAAAKKQQTGFGSLRVDPMRLSIALKLRHMVFAHRMYLEAIADYIEQGGGSRASSLVIAAKGQTGTPVHPLLTDWRVVPENLSLRKKIQHLRWNPEKQTVEFTWIDTQPIPTETSWFETVWAHYLDGSVFR
jgi:succinate dehydrogenase/fumarate reductase flavoprotein subunit